MMLHRCVAWYAAACRLLDRLQPLFALAARIYLARVFLLAGLTKLRDWDVTLLLFTEEYHVPLLPPGVAAVAGTVTELFFPVLLLFGLGGRVAALVLFVFNTVAVISYPGLEAVEIKDHVLWGVLLMYLVVHGTGTWSLSRWVGRGSTSR